MTKTLIVKNSAHSENSTEWKSALTEAMLKHTAKVTKLIGNPLLTCENVALNLNWMICMTNILFMQNSVRSEIQRGGNLVEINLQPKRNR